MKSGYTPEEDEYDLRESKHTVITVLSTSNKAEQVEQIKVNSRICLDCSAFTKTKNCSRCVSCTQAYNKAQQKLFRDTKNYKLDSKYKYKLYIRRAIERGYAFDLSYDEFMLYWNKPCYYCNNEITTIGLDRVDNNIGYSVNNIVPCCTTCNRMKMTLSQNDFITKCITISNLHKTVQ